MTKALWLRRILFPPCAARGYDARVQGSSSRADEPVQSAAREAARVVKRRFWLSLAFLLPLMYVSMGHMIPGALPYALSHNPGLFALAQFVLTLPVLFLNRGFFIRGVNIYLPVRRIWTVWSHSVRARRLRRAWRCCSALFI